MAESIIISNPAELERKKEAIRAGGAKNLHVVSDFDKTLTKSVVNGERRQSLIELIRKYGYLSPEYVKRAYELFDEYHPFEVDPTLDAVIKGQKMQEWWSTHVKVMGQYGMNREMVQKIIHEQPLNPREGLGTFLDTLYSRNIPLLILSGSITDLIEGFLKKEHFWRENIHVYSNRFAFDENGGVTGYQGKIIHALNKGEHAIADTPHFSRIAERRNVLLMGDSIDDVDMVNGMEYDTVLKIGFFNGADEAHLPHFKKVYDVLILNDGPMDYVNGLLNEMTM